LAVALLYKDSVVDSTSEESMENDMNAMRETLNGDFARRAAAILALACVFGLGVTPASAAERDLPDIKAADAVLYEVSENMYLLDAAGNVVGPEAAVRRKADASLYGWARVGNPLCPADVLVTNPHAHTCTVTAAGIDDIALDTFMGGVGGTFAVVLQDDNNSDSPEFVIMNGAFKGAMDLSKRPLGKISGTFVPAGSTQPTPFCGTFRLPFSVSKGRRGQPARHAPAYYLADDFVTLIPVHPQELSLGMATVRLELSFSGNCAKF
jgi:hypothetical protein